MLGGIVLDEEVGGKYGRKRAGRDEASLSFLCSYSQLIDLCSATWCHEMDMLRLVGLFFCFVLLVIDMSL